MVKNVSKNSKIKSLKQRYNNEFDFISNLLNVANIPSQQSDSSETEDDEEDSKIKNEIIRLKNTERAKSLEELHKRLTALREQKYTYRGKKLKNKLQSKLKRKKKIHENKTKRNASYKNNEDVVSLKNKREDVKLSKPIFNAEGNLVFSKFDFLGETTTVTDKKILTNDARSNKKHILEKLQKNQNLIKKLEETGNTEKAERIKEEIAWKNMFIKTEGLKIKDDCQLLKKSLAKKQAKKKSSEKKWKQRVKTIEKQKLEKQKKRTENVNKRLQEKKKKKFKKAIKKGRYVPNI
ncbi:hypothetical protein PGB90_003014 [Kerria lacca]